LWGLAADSVELAEEMEELVDEEDSKLTMSGESFDVCV